MLQWTSASGSASFPYFQRFLSLGPSFPSKSFTAYLLSKLAARHGLPSPSKYVRQSVANALRISVREEGGEDANVIYMYAQSPSVKVLDELELEVRCTF